MMPARWQSLTLIVTVTDAEACAAELEASRSALEAGWQTVPGLHTACVALLPKLGSDQQGSSALFLECSFDGAFEEVAGELFRAAGSALSAVLAHGAGFPEHANARTFKQYLSARARRSSAFGDASEGVRSEPGAALRRVLAAARRYWPGAGITSESPLSDAELELRRAAVGMQEPLPGVPLLHLAWLEPEPRALSRLKQALRDLELEAAGPGLAWRFLLHGERVLFLAYPSEDAPRWSERLSVAAPHALSRLWSNTRGFSVPFSARRALRARRLQQFLLDYRVPVSAWFNADQPRG